MIKIAPTNIPQEVFTTFLNDIEAINRNVEQKTSLVTTSMKHVPVDRVVDVEQEFTSESVLYKHLNIEDIHTSRASRMFKFDRLNIAEKCIDPLTQIYPTHSIIPSGHFYYPPEGFMSWHTNSDISVDHLYITYCDQDDQSYFRYYDQKTNQVVTDYDKKGFNVRLFDTPKEKTALFWHCVYSKCNRYSLGFRIKQNLCIT